ncbi:MAG: DUF1080 domain-containing protein [Planctomycetaceae bacterium]
MNINRIPLSVVALAIIAAPALPADKEGFKPLFNGKDLTGWKQRNGTAKYSVEKGGVILGKTNEGSPNSFLCTTKHFGDFELTFEVKVDDALNSGVQFRSASRKDFKNFRVHGPQVEIAVNGTAGFIYGEALGTGWLSDKAKVDRKTKAFKNGKWNKYRVLARGKSIKTWVNGVPVADLVDERSKMSSGFIGLQVHGIRRGSGPYEVRWRKIMLRDLSK